MPAEPAAHSLFESKPVFILEDEAPAPIRKLYDDIKRSLDLPYVNSEYRGFARWPDFLQSLWSALKPVVQSPIYLESQSGIRETAWSLLHELPPVGGLSTEELNEAGVDEDEVSDVARLTDLFLRNFSGMALNVSFAKIGMEGGSRKASSTAPQATPQRAA